MTLTALRPHHEVTAAVPLKHATGAPPLGLADAVSHACLAAVLDEFDTGAVICNARAQALALNEAARRDIASGGALCLLADGSLGVRGDGGLLALRRAIRHAALESRHELLPLRGDRRTTMVAVRPLPQAPAGQPLALLLLGRPEPCPELAVLALSRLFALTPSEQEVLSQLLAGVRIKDMARSRGVALCTVRCQVAALRMKLGVHRIDDMTRMAAELPPMMGVLRTSLSRCFATGAGAGAGAGTSAAPPLAPGANSQPERN